MTEKVQEKERFFSIELGSKANLKNLSLTNGSDDSALVEGTIGKLVEAGFVEGELLEIVGDKGIFRINLTPSELNSSPQRSTVAEPLKVQNKMLGEVD